MSLLHTILLLYPRCFRVKRRPFFTDPPLAGLSAPLQ
jgi:hypothetical protein